MDRRVSLCDTYTKGTGVNLDTVLSRWRAMKQARLARKSEQGQISVMMGAMMLTFIFFFAFAVNTGMLVNAKINLQNAADMAAYAGAAVQARQLNEISYLNYEMRRAYKKFLFRYYIVGNAAMEKFPTASGGNMLWSPTGDPSNDYGIPIVCVTHNTNDNPCHVKKLPQIKMPPLAAFDSISAATKQVLEQIEKHRIKNCDELGKANMLLLHMWLWNTDPDFRYFEAFTAMEENEIKAALAVVKGLGAGLGLVPREAILRQRIGTIASYVNTAPEKNIDLSRVNSLKTLSAVDRPAHERKIQAFLSAYYTLGNYIYAGGNVSMDELLPDVAPILDLQDIKTQFDAYSIDFNAGSGGDCNPTAIWDGLKTPLTVGVKKNPASRTYYAVRLKAKAKILFSPVGQIELTAYSAAMPFGSRIGPQLEGSAFVMQATPNLENSETFPSGAIPNLAVMASDSDTPVKGQGFDRQSVIQTLFSNLKKEAMGDAISTTQLAKAYYAAMAPTPYEAGKYNIPLDSDSDQFQRFYDTTGSLAIWAPVLGTSAGAASDLESLISNFMPAGAGRHSGAADAASIAAKNAISTYIERMRKDDGERPELPYGSHGLYPESLNIAHIVSPLPPPSGALGTTASAPPWSSGVKFRTSWNDIYSAEDKGDGRVGYSVKFVSFDWIKRSASNPIPAPDPDLEADLFYMTH